jgi:hypothetical protein
LLADVLERVAGRGALAAATGGHAGAELERAQLLVGQRLALERVVLTALEHRPAQHHQLACGGHDRDLGASPGADALIEGAQRTGDLRRDERGFDEHPARVRATVLGDPAVGGGLAAGLLHARIEAEV